MTRAGHRIASLLGAGLLGLVLLAASIPADAGEITRGTDPYRGQFKTTKWRAGNTDFVHTTYYNSDGKRNYSERWTKKAGAGEGATIRYTVQAPVKTKGTIWTANGTTTDHRKLTDERGGKMNPERWVYGKNTVRGKGEFLVGGQMMDIKMWKTGKGNVLGIERTTVGGKTTVRRFGQSTLPKLQAPSFLGK